MSLKYKWQSNSGSIELVSVVSKIGEPEHLLAKKMQTALGYHRLGHLEEAKTIYQQILEINPKHSEALHLLGCIAYEAGGSDFAIELIEKALAQRPDYVDAHNNLGNVFQAQGRLEEAIACYEQALILKPDYADAHNNLGNVFRTQGRLEEARACLEQALILEPGHVDAHNNMGNVLQEQGRLVEAIACYEQALVLKPDLVEAHNNLGMVLGMLGRLKEAIVYLEQALALNPDHANSIYNMGIIFKQQGRLEEARIYFERALALKPDYAEAHRSLALTKKYTVEDEQTTVIKKLFNQLELADKDAVHLHFAMGKIHDDCQLFEEAFRYYDQGNKLKRKTLAFDVENHREFIDKLIEVYSEEYFLDRASLGSDSDLPVFIIGMNRSGTTLVEQIISNHPQVYGAGELVFLEYVESTIASKMHSPEPYPECMLQLDKQVSRTIVSEYLANLRSSSSKALKVTDKMPRNYLSLGLIRTLFPRSRIIHCRRNPLDTCLSNYFQYFTFGNSYTYDLNDLGRVYSQYERLMAHWRVVMQDQMLEIEYEDLVEDQEKASRKLIEHLGLEWDDRCLQFHKNTSSVRTASGVQVRQPMYSSSVARWKNYEKYLDPLKDGLEAGKGV